MRRWEGMGEEQVRVKIAALTALFGVYVLFQRAMSDNIHQCVVV
jgi:hypothetical protein